MHLLMFHDPLKIVCSEVLLGARDKMMGDDPGWWHGVCLSWSARRRAVSVSGLPVREVVVRQVYGPLAIPGWRIGRQSRVPVAEVLMFGGAIVLAHNVEAAACAFPPEACPHQPSPHVDTRKTVLL
jgi:hypothetical protein